MPDYHFQTHLRTLMRQKSAHDDREITQMVVADAVNTGQSTISRWVNGQVQELDLSLAARLMAYFGCASITDLIELKPTNGGDPHARE